LAFLSANFVHKKRHQSDYARIGVACWMEMPIDNQYLP
jgi:hypothetical protein